VRQPDQSQQADAGNIDENIAAAQNQAEPAVVEGKSQCLKKFLLVQNFSRALRIGCISLNLR